MPSQQIVFKSGTFQDFTATRTFGLGSTGISLHKGQEVQYDGTTAIVGGSEYSLPQLRTTIQKLGWLVPSAFFDEDDTTAEQPKAAGLLIRHPTKMGNPFNPSSTTEKQRMEISTDSDERVVGNAAMHAQTTQTQNKTPRTVRRASMSEDEGVVVRELTTLSGEAAKKARVNILNGDLSEAVSQAAKVRITPEQGLTEKEFLSRLSPDEASEYLAKKEAKRSARPVTENVDVLDPDMYSKEFSSGSTKKVVQDGITFTVTAPPVQPLTKTAPVMSEDIRRKVATALCADFPANYDFSVSDKKKIARLRADYEDRPDVIQAVYAAEGDDFKSILVQEFPEAF